jgi:hypothetical protein
MSSIRVALVILVPAFLVGCATTEITTFKDPEYGSRQYETIYVVTSGLNLADRDLTEAKVCEAFSEIEINCIRDIEIFLPTRSYTGEEKAATLRKLNIDASLGIQLTANYSDQTYIPQTSFTSGNTYDYGYSSSYSGTTYSFGGYAANTPVEEYQIVLIDAKSGQQALVATGKTQGDDAVNTEGMRVSLAEEIVETLIAEDMLLVSKAE